MRSTVRSKPAEQARAAAAGRAVQPRGRSRSLQRKPVAETAEIVAGLASIPRIAAQAKQLKSTFGNAIQPRTGLQDEEGLLQGKSATLQRKSADEDELLQGRFEPVQRQGLEEEELQMKKAAPSKPPVQPKNNTGLPDHLKAGIETLSGMAMDDVRVHYSSSKPARLQALAYAQGNDIHVATGQERHLPHEAWHVVQQVQGRVKPTTQLKDGVSVNGDPGLEHEADVMGARAAVVGRLATRSRLSQDRTGQDRTRVSRAAIGGAPTTATAVQSTSGTGAGVVVQRVCNDCGYEKGHAPWCTPETRARNKALREEQNRKAHDQSMDNRTRADQTHVRHGNKNQTRLEKQTGGKLRYQKK
jgi:hypothetical protein